MTTFPLLLAFPISCIFYLSDSPACWHVSSPPFYMETPTSGTSPFISEDPLFLSFSTFSSPMLPDSYLQLHWTWSVRHTLLQTCQGHFTCHIFWDEPRKWCLGILWPISIYPFLSFSSKLVSIQNVISFCLNLNTGRRGATERDEVKLAPSLNLSPGAYLLLHTWAFGRRSAPGSMTAVCCSSRERGVKAGRLGREAWRVALVCPWVLWRGRRTNEMADPCPGVLSFQTSLNSITKASNPALDISPSAHKLSMVSTHLQWRVSTSNQGESSKCSMVKHYSFPSVRLRVGMFSCFATSHSLWPHGLWPTRLLCAWDSPGKNTRVGCHGLLQGIFPTQGSNPCLLYYRWILYHWATREALWELKFC